MARSTIERFRHELDTDYIDIVLLHCLTVEGWDQQMGPYMEVLAEEKAKGRIKARRLLMPRFSSHANRRGHALGRRDPGPDQHEGRQGSDDGRLARTKSMSVLRLAKENGKAIIGMKIFGEGRLADQRDACMKYAQELGLLDAMTIGFHTPEQIDDVLRLMHKYPAKTVA